MKKLKKTKNKRIMSIFTWRPKLCLKRIVCSGRHFLVIGEEIMFKLKFLGVFVKLIWPPAA